MNYNEKQVSVVEDMRKKMKEMFEYRGKDHPTNNFERPKLNALNSLVSCTNSWIRLDKYFNEDEFIKPYYEEACEEAMRDNCHSSVSIMIMTIKKVLDEIED